MVNETNIVEKKEDEHVEEKKKGGQVKKEQLVHLEQQRKSKTRGTLVADKDRK